MNNTAFHITLYLNHAVSMCIAKHNICCPAGPAAGLVVYSALALVKRTSNLNHFALTSPICTCICHTATKHSASHRVVCNHTTCAVECFRRGGGAEAEYPTSRFEPAPRRTSLGKQKHRTIQVENDLTSIAASLSRSTRSNFS